MVLLVKLAQTNVALKNDAEKSRTLYCGPAKPVVAFIYSVPSWVIMLAFDVSAMNAAREIVCDM